MIFFCRTNISFTCEWVWIRVHQANRSVTKFPFHERNCNPVYIIWLGSRCARFSQKQSRCGGGVEKHADIRMPQWQNLLVSSKPWKNHGYRLLTGFMLINKIFCPRQYDIAWRPVAKSKCHQVVKYPDCHMKRPKTWGNLLSTPNFGSFEPPVVSKNRNKHVNSSIKFAEAKQSVNFMEEFVRNNRYLKDYWSVLPKRHFSSDTKWLRHYAIRFNLMPPNRAPNKCVVWVTNIRTGWRDPKSI